MHKSVILLLAIVFLTTSNIVTYLPVKAETKTIVVPDDYSTIQEAIDIASAGDTVFVKKGIYNVHSIGITKLINLVGEDRDQTIINGGRDQNKAYPIPWNLVALTLYASNIAVSGFTFTNCFVVISNSFSLSSHISLDSVKISGNSFVGNNRAIHIDDDYYVHAKNCIISDNTFTDNVNTIEFYGEESEISRNVISGNLYGIYMYEANNVGVRDNRLVNNTFALTLKGTANIDVYRNIIANTTRFFRSVVKEYSSGIEFSHCNNSIVHDNSIEENSVGIYLEGSKGSGNLVYHNNFIDNAQNVNVEQQSGYNTTDVINVKGVVSWDRQLLERL